MAGRSKDRSGTRILQIQYGLPGEPGRGKRRSRLSNPQWNESLTGVHGHVAAALLAEMQDVQGPACFENCETGVQVLKVHPPSRSGGSNVVGTRDQIRVVEKPWKSGRPEDGRYHVG